uniref:C-type lectin domain-containing protein n=1 Tax=Electrophorus electricus TaxID=8005 RepID=A0AAY5EDW0_ELEEL
GYILMNILMIGYLNNVWIHVPDSTCPVGWTALGSSIYYISKATNDWSHSRKDCQERGADLVVINSREEQNNFITHIGAIENVTLHSDRVWTGLVNDPWNWSDQSNSEFRNWKSNSPNTLTPAEKCVTVKRADKKESWNIESCEKKHPFICHESEQSFTSSL